MNPALLKALIISGGTIGLGVPGIYYGYPYISNLINPETKKDVSKPVEGEKGEPKPDGEQIQDSSGISTSLKIARNTDETSQVGASKDDKSEEESNTEKPKNGEGSDTAMDTDGQGPKNGPATSYGGSISGAPGPLPPSNVPATAKNNPPNGAK